MKYLSLWIAVAFSLTACETTPATKTNIESNNSFVQTQSVPFLSPTPAPQPPEPEKPKYKKLIYGAEMPLVCGKTITAEGKLKTRPNMQVMWENYLYDRPEGIWGEIGGLVEVNGTLPLSLIHI